MEKGLGAALRAELAQTDPRFTAETEVERLRREVVRLRRQMGEEAVAAAVAYDGSVQFLQNRCSELQRELEQSPNAQREATEGGENEQRD